MITWWHTIILGIVEGITEFLPISSTGHLILTADILHIQQSEFLKSFEIIIQLGAILAVVALYWRSLFTSKETIKRLIVAFIPTAIVGLLFYKTIKQYLLSDSTLVVWTLLLGGLGLIIFEHIYKEKETATGEISKISYKQSFIIGLFQSVALIPGISRAAATIIGGLLLGLKRRTIVEFSFLLAVPTMAAASGLDLIKNAGQFSRDQFGFLALGLTISFITALFSIKWLLRFIKNHTFTSFGIYRIAVAVIFLFLR